MGLVLGIDVSHHQGVMDWKKAKDAGATFGFVRCGSITEKTGDCYTDYQWARNIIEAPKHLPIRSYFYYRPNHSAKLQADYTSGLLEPFVKNGTLLSYAVDDEVKVKHPFSDTLTYLKRMEYNLGIRGMIYTGPDAWDNYITGDKSEAKNYDLWIANYEVIKPYIPKPWKKYTVWQYSADGNGRGHEFGASGSQSIDLNWAEESWVGSSIVIEPPKPEPFKEKWMEIQIDRYNIRSTPTTMQGDFGDLQRKRKVKVVGQEGDWYKVEGYVYKAGLKEV